MEDVESLEMYEEKRKPTCYANTYHYFLDFCKNTKIHGFQYIGDRSRYMIEKLYWMMFMCISFSVCMMLLKEFWVRNQSSIFVSFTRNPEPVWNVPFPAVTVCSETKVRQRVYNFTDDYHRIKGTGKVNNVTSLEQFSEASLVCGTNLRLSGYETANATTVERLISFAPPLEEMFFSCAWSDGNESCGNLFTRVLTDEGVCFTFNMLDREEFLKDTADLHPNVLSHGRQSTWTLDDGYAKNSGKDTFPKRTAMGLRNGLTLLLRSNEQDFDYVCSGPNQGFKVHLHNPSEIPRLADHHFKVSTNQEVVIAVKPDVRRTSSRLKHYSPYERQCFFAGERTLRFFQTYTYENCRAECLANFTLQRCGCVSYYMPRDGSSKICGRGRQTCVSDTERELEEPESKTSPNCECLPACTSISYDAETSQVDFHWPKVFESLKTNKSEFPGLHLSKVTIFFKNMQFAPTERNVLYTKTDFLANCGGLLALFSGFSLLSLAEIFYYLTLRLVCNVRKFGKLFWAGYSK